MWRNGYPSSADKVTGWTGGGRKTKDPMNVDPNLEGRAAGENCCGSKLPGRREKDGEVTTATKERADPNRTNSKKGFLESRKP